MGATEANLESVASILPVGGLKPEHFTGYMKPLVETRKLGRHARKRVRTYLSTFLRYGAKNGWYIMPNTGTDWVAPPRPILTRCALHEHA